MNSDEKSKLFWAEVQHFCVQYQAESAKLPHPRRPPNRFEIPNQIVFNSPEEYYQSIYHQFLAHAFDTLRCRITNKYMPVLERSNIF